MTKSVQELPMTKEVASALWAQKCLADKAWAKQIQSDPAAAIDWDKDEQSVSTVQNTADTLNICVPDYRGLDDAVNQLSDEQMAGVSGGLFFLFGLLGLIGTGGLASTCAVVGSAGYAGASVADANARNNVRPKPVAE